MDKKKKTDGSILIIAGENSGENYGAGLVRQFKGKNPFIEFFGIGGKHMVDEGVDLLFSIKELSVVGIVEIISHLPRIKRIFARLRKEIKHRKPLAAVLIDSPDFNLRLAKILRKLSIPVLYYISPTIWAWRKSRLKTIKKRVTKMMLIFPFEEEIYNKYNIPAVYVGHPLKERIKTSLSKEEFFRKYEIVTDRKLIALLPGSRKSEIKYHMPVLFEGLSRIKREYDVQFLLLLAENLDRSFISNFIPSNFEKVKIISEDRHEAIKFSDLILSSCGTANLESALLETPLISFYRVSPITFFLGVPFVKIKNYSIVNILAGKKIIPELIQKHFTPDNIFKETKRILDSEEIRSEMLNHFQKIKGTLGEKIASQNAAAQLEQLVFEINQQ